MKPYLTDPISFLKTDSKVEYISQYDWENSIAGPPQAWPDNFKFALQFITTANFPALLFWGEENQCYYNTLFSTGIDQLYGHPEAFGKPAKAIWKQSGTLINSLIDDAKNNDEQSSEGDSLSVFFQAQFKERFTGYSLLRISDRDNNTCGLLVACSLQATTFTDLNADHRFQKLVEQASVGIIVLTGSTFKVEVVNEMCARFIGLTTSQLLGQPLFELLPEKEKTLRPPVEQVRATSQPVYFFELPYNIVADEVKTGYANLTYQPYQTDISNDGVLILYHDVTELVNNRKKIQDTEAKARLAIESADLGTYELNLSTDELITSERFRAIWGVEESFSRSEFAGMIHPEDREIRARAHSHASSAGQLSYEVRIIRPDKEIRWIKVNGKILYNKNRAPVTLLGVVQDITPLREFTDALAAIVQERTIELQRVNEQLATTNEELSEANDSLTNANKELEQFAYVASHDLQEPLRKIIMFTNMLNDRFQPDLPGAAVNYLRKISSSAERMSNLIRDLLDYSRLSYKNSLFEKVDLNVVVSNVLQDYEVLINQKKVIISTESLPTVEAIPIHMSQVMYNLVGNALKFSRSDIQATIHISAQKLGPEELKLYSKFKSGKTYYQVSIRDNGIGFSQQYAEKIFTIFQQLHDKATYGGYGIGLSLCRRVIENHKGIIFASGDENKGATFSFIIPETQSQKLSG